MFKKIAIIFIVFSITLLMFTYGVIVGTYKTFPYHQIQLIKSAISKDSGLTESITTSSGYSSYKELFQYLSSDYDIVFVGDSVTNHGRWNEAFLDKKVANRGIVNDTSEGILNRADQIVALKPDTIYLMFGINDIINGESAEEIFKRYQEIVSTLAQDNPEIIIQSTLLTNRDGWNIEVNKLNNYLIDFSQQNNYKYVDLNKVLAPSGMLTADASDDGVHLKPAMYIKWFEIIRDNAN